MNALEHLTVHQLFDFFSGVVLVASLLSSFLPPYEWFSKWPNFQAGYKIFTMTITKWAALNIKSFVYPQISQPAPSPPVVVEAAKP